MRSAPAQPGRENGRTGRVSCEARPGPFGNSRHHLARVDRRTRSEEEQVRFCKSGVARAGAARPRRDSRKVLTDRLLLTLAVGSRRTGRGARRTVRRTPTPLSPARSTSCLRAPWFRRLRPRTVRIPTLEDLFAHAEAESIELRSAPGTQAPSRRSRRSPSPASSGRARCTTGPQSAPSIADQPRNQAPSSARHGCRSLLGPDGRRACAIRAGIERLGCRDPSRP